ncbi:ATP-binding protein [Acidithiobacillus sp. AMEEHan]|uniref:sensor histidine kinase n=1 Tax=Acidithiobacillus sp. AMEEHan TaxID=2994951 RepID=UPI0027E4F66B|nr:ATP-binding protein [Acidithiobacillus sp. AMEEHan]
MSTAAPSLQRRLFWTLSFWLILGGVIAAAVDYGLAYEDAKHLQDATLAEIAQWVDPAHLPQHDLRAPWFRHKQNHIDHDEEFGRVIVERVGIDQNNDALPIPSKWKPGFHHLQAKGEHWRVFLAALPSGDRLAVAQPISVLQEAAWDGAQQSIWPILLLLPIVLLALRWQVYSVFRPLRRLARELSALQPDKAQIRLPSTPVPRELLPFWLAIQELLQRVADLMQTERRFIADAAHELRTPLAALSLQVENAERAASWDSCRQRLQQVDAGLARSRHLLDQLLTLERQLAGTEKRESIELGELLREILGDRLPVAESKGIDLELQMPSGPLPLYTEALALRVLISNVLDNALRYAPAKSLVAVRVQAHEDTLQLEIEDEGPGIPPAQRELIFSPFHRAADAEGEGTGLGLAIVAAAARRLGGSIELRDGHAGRGLLFQYRQPLAGMPPAGVA